LGAAIDASNEYVASQGDFYCEHKGPKKIHYTTVKRSDISGDSIMYSETWMKVDTSDKLSYITKRYTPLDLYDPTNPSISTTVEYAVSGKRPVSLYVDDQSASCNYGIKFSDSPAVHDLVSLKSLGEAYDFSTEQKMQSYDDFETRNINGFSCQYGEFGPGLFGCFSKEHCATVFTGIDIQTTASLSANGKSATLSTDDASVDVSVDLPTDVQVDSQFVIDISRTVNMVSISYDEFPDTVFDVDVDTTKCSDSDEFLRVSAKYDSYTDPDFAAELATLPSGDLTADDYSVSNEDFISRGEEAVAKILANE
ncbi:MAG: hypothetical protein ACI8Y7_000975, partial [Candidatus Woesearchaeota archaeon]